MDEYQYSLLDPQVSSIRLLRLHAGNTTSISCEIFHIDLSAPDGVSYEALSYTWGSVELVEHIEVHGQRLGITDNLYSALTNLRFHDRDRILWIDAVCIDQDNKAEQGQQVQMMDRIFGCATRVIFWLGKATKEVTLLMRSLGELQAACNALPQTVTQLDSRIWQRCLTRLQLRSTIAADDILIRLRESLQMLLGKPWFERVWILQEVYNARSAVVCCGPSSVSAEIFRLCPSLLHERPSEYVQSVLNMMPEISSLHSRPRKVRHELINLLAEFHACKATDPRDMVFALLGMSSEPLDHDLLRADYTLPMAGVLNNTVRYWLRETATSIERILDCFSNFQAVRTTYLMILPTSSITEKMRDTPFSPEMIKTFQFKRDVSLFFLEDMLNAGQGSFHVELDQLEAISTPGGAKQSWFRNFLQVVPWLSDSHTVKVLVIYDVFSALEWLSGHKYQQTFNFVALHCLENTPGRHDNALFRIAMDGDPYLQHVLLHNRVEVDAQREHENPTQARSVVREQTVRMLLARGANIEAQGPQGAALWHASVSNCEQIVQMLLDHGAVIDAKGNGGTALEVASLKGHDQVVKKLLNHGADINLVGKDGTALEVASFRGHDQVVEKLLNHRADINLVGKGGTALEVASFGGHEQVVEKLLNHGADINLVGNGSTALMAASSRGHEQVVEKLLNHRADINLVGWWYGTALEVASLKGHDQVVEKLLNHGADINLMGKDGTALEAASRRGHKNVVQRLLDHGADLGPSSGRYGSALGAAALAQEKEIVQLLLDRGADVNAGAGDYGSILQAASFHGSNDDLRQIFLDHGADVNAFGW